MKKDIFIDNNIAKNFATPLDPEYKKLTSWLLNNNALSNDRAYLVVSNKIINEYNRSCQNSIKPTSIVIIIDKLTKEGRLNKKTNSEIKKYKVKNFDKKTINSFNSNTEDHDHIAIVLMSDRKYALVKDNNLYRDLLKFKCVTVAKKPQDLSY